MRLIYVFAVALAAILITVVVVLKTKEERAASGQKTNTQGLSETELAELYEHLESVHNLFSQFKIPYWLTGGSLLGAVRHAGQIPWDDDADICVPHTFEEVMQSDDFKKALWERGLVFDSSGYVAKIYRPDDNTVNSFPVPWIDVFFVTQNPDDQTWSFHKDSHIKHWPTCHASIPDGAIHPTTPCKFGHLELQCPQDAHYELSRCYGENYMTEFKKYEPHNRNK